MVAFNRRVGEVRWAGWRSASLGEGQRTALLLHGTGGARHSWGPMLERLDPAIAILAPDLPGHGLRAARSTRVMALRTWRATSRASSQRKELTGSI